VNKAISMSSMDTTIAGAGLARSVGLSQDAYPQALLALPPGEARESLLAVHGILRAELPKGTLSLYEAGGGSTSFLPLDVVARAHTTVVDLDEEQLRNNDYAQRRIVGDIQDHQFPSDSFDFVICYNVLEHVPDVAAALTRLFQPLKRGGLVLIGAPNPHSLSGAVTKYSPHWFHRWFYRYIIGNKLAGLPGQPPFPTFYHPLVTPSKLVAFAKAHGLELVYRREYENVHFAETRERIPLLGALLDAFAVTLNFLLPGDTEVRRGDYHIILRKR
jgi:SAM-dependent methyltransferase